MSWRYVGLTDPVDDPLYAENGWAARQPETLFAMGQFFDSQLETGIGGTLLRGLRREFTDPVMPWWIDRQQDAIVTADLNERYGIPGRLEFRHRMSERAAQELHNVAKREEAAEALMQLAGVNGALSLATSLAAGLVDPANIALSFTPLPWINRLQTLEQGMGALSRVGFRAGVGALEGAAGAAMVEPLIYSLNQAEGNDYTFADSLVNVFVGAGAGAVFRPLLLGAADWMGGVPAGSPAESRGAGVEPDEELAAAAGIIDRSQVVDLATVAPERLPENFAARVRPAPGVPEADPMPPIAREAGDTTRLTAMARAVEQLTDGTDIDVAPVFAVAEAGSLDELARHGQGRAIEARPIKAGVAVTPDNQELEVTWSLVELDDLVASNGPDGEMNPDYPQALQPRDRSAVTSAVQVFEIARTLNPTRLGETFDAQTGAPVVGTDGLVESGNGRVLALQAAFAENGEAAARYRGWLEDQGYPVDGMRQPVLVRLADARRPADARIAFARGSNAKQVAGYDVAGQARLDAEALRPEDVELHKGGPVTAAANGAFARQALGRLVLPAELDALVDKKTGYLSPGGVKRLEAALAHFAYEDAALVNELFDQTDDVMRGLGRALVQVAPAWARMRAAVARGEVAAAADGTTDLQAALSIARAARNKGITVAEQVKTLDLFDELGPATQAFLRLFFGDDLMRQAPVQRITAGLDKYLEQAMLARPEPDLFGTAAPPDAGQLAALGLRAGEAEADAGDVVDAASPVARAPAPIERPPAPPPPGPRPEPPEQAEDGPGGSAAPQPPEPAPSRSRGLARTLAAKPDPELDRLLAAAAEVEAEIQQLAGDGLLDPADAEALAALSQTRSDDVQADALRAGVMCLLSNPLA